MACARSTRALAWAGATAGAARPRTAAAPRATAGAPGGGPPSLGAAEHGDHLAARPRHAQQLPAALAHVGAPADELLPLLIRGAKHPQIRVLLPLCRVGLRGR